MPRIQHKRGTSTNLTAANPTPLAGELVWDSTENAIKIGDGSTAWTSLAYVTATPRSHKSQHATGGSDALTPSDIGAAPAASPAITGNATFEASSGVPVTITNTGTGNSFVVNDASGDTTPFVVDADGNVGIGTTPASFSSSFNNLVVGNGSSVEGMTIYSSTQGTLAFGDTATTGADGYRGYLAYIHSGDYMVIGTGGTERFRAYASGVIVSGVITVSATSGSAGSYAPSLTFSGDPNTGFGQVSGQSDTASIFTAGHERVRVDSSGRILVGATSGTYPLTVVSDSGARAVDIRGRVTGNISVVDFTSNDGATRYGRFDARPAFFQVRGPENAYIALSKHTGESVFEVHHSGKVKFVPMATDPAEGLEGDVYFNSATNALTWHDGVRWVAAAPTFNPTFTVKVTVPAGTASDPAIVASGDSNTGLAFATDTLIFATAGVERVRVDSSGRVGVGAAPSYALDVHYNDSYQLRLKRTGSGQAGLRLEDSSGNFHQLASASNIFVVTSGATERLRLDASGRFGVGTTGPTALLDINSDTLRLRTARTPASASAAGNAGDICWDADYVYVCTSANVWKRAALSTW